MNTKHTPAPWRHFPYAGQDYGICAENDTTGRDLAIVRGDRGNQGEHGDDANAAHIVRCVNSHDALLEALQQCMEYLQHPGGEHLPAGAWFRVNEAVRAAIAKATQ